MLIIMLHAIIIIIIIIDIYYYHYHHHCCCYVFFFLYKIKKNYRDDSLPPVAVRQLVLRRGQGQAQRRSPRPAHGRLSLRGREVCEAREQVRPEPGCLFPRVRRQPQETIRAGGEMERRARRVPVEELGLGLGSGLGLG